MLYEVITEHLGAQAMICETGRKDTPLTTRCRYHRHLVLGLLRHLKMVPADLNAAALNFIAFEHFVVGDVAGQIFRNNFV